MHLKIRTLCFFLSLLLKGSLSLGYQNAQVIGVDASANEHLNLSKIADSLNLIVLEPAEDHPFLSINGVILDKDYIFISVFTKIKDKDGSKILQYDHQGKFVRQLGDDFNGLISLIYDPARKRVGASDGKNVTYHSYDGRILEVTKTVVQEEIYFKNHFWSVGYEFSTAQVKYVLKKRALNSSRIKDIFEFYDKSQGVVGTPVRFSVVKDHLYFWDNFNHTFFEILDEDVQPSLELNINKGIKPRSYAQIKGNWVFIPALDQRRRMSLLKFVNRVNGEIYSAYERKSNNGMATSGILDDISDTGFLNIFDMGPVYGDVDNKLIFIKKKDDIPQLENSSQPDGSYTLLIVTLK